MIYCEYGNKNLGVVSDVWQGEVGWPLSIAATNTYRKL